MSIAPLRDGLIVKPDAEEMKTESGLILKSAAPSAVRFGEIIVSGPCIDDERIVVGSRVMFLNTVGTPIKIDGEWTLFMEEQNIMAVVLNESE